MGGDETPLAGQTRCPFGHLCSGRDAYCSVCGEALDKDGGDD